MNSILERSQWTDKSIDFLAHDIVEYDMKDGGFSMIKQDALLPPDKINWLEKMPKKQRHITVGKLNNHRDFKGFGKVMESGFRKYRLLFGEQNELTDNDILSVKRDAIFTKKFCYNTSIGEYVEFKEKNIYQAYMYINKLEFYWKDDGTLHVKGIDDALLDNHQDYMILIIWKFMRYLVSFDDERALRYIVDTMDKYKMLELDVGVYREFKRESGYPILEDGSLQYVAEIGDSRLPSCNINYNYMNIFVPMLNLVSIH
jgi:hypothetical protein